MEPIIPPISTPGLSQSGGPAQAPASAPEGVSFADLVTQASASANGKAPVAPSEAEMVSAAQGLAQLLAPQNLRLHFAIAESGKPVIELQDLESGETVRSLRTTDVLTSLQEQSIDPLTA